MTQSLPDSNTFYHEYYNKPAYWFRFRYDTQFKVKSALNALKKIKFNSEQKKIFEFGFGSGELIFKFKNVALIGGKEISSYAVDLATEKAKKKNLKSYFNLIREVPANYIPEIKYNLIIASHVIEHIEDTDNFIEQITKIILPGGLLLLQFPLHEKYEDPKHYHKFTTQQIEKIMTKRKYSVEFKSENEFLYHIVEDLYWENDIKRWNLVDNLKRIIFNILLAPLPWFILSKVDLLYGRLFGKMPRQAIIILRKK